VGDRFYSCVIDGTKLDASGQLEADPDHPELLRPTYRIELPGFPILGNGKSDNQNMAIPYSRGPIIQAIDCNQARSVPRPRESPCFLRQHPIRCWVHCGVLFTTCIQPSCAPSQSQYSLFSHAPSAST
jgi:hypothetical protein